MADNPPVEIPQWEWVKVATKTKSVRLHIKETTPIYYRAFREYDQESHDPPDPPDAITKGEIPSEAVRLFSEGQFEHIESGVDIDLYVFCRNQNNIDSEDIGAIYVGPYKNTIDVYIQDQTSDITDYYMCRQIADLQLAAPTVIDNRNISVVNGAGVVNGTYVCIQENRRAFQARVMSGGGTNALVLDTPLDNAFTTSASIANRNPELAVAGNVDNPVIASLKPAPGVQWDITKINGTILTPFANGAASDPEFGGNPALTYGFILRKSNTIHHTIFNAKTNGDLKLRCGARRVTYTTASSPNPYGVTFERVFNGQPENGVAIRLDGDKGESLDILLQDPEMANLTSFKVVAQGHVVI